MLQGSPSSHRASPILLLSFPPHSVLAIPLGLSLLFAHIVSVPLCREIEKERETSARRQRRLQPRGSNSSRTISNAKRTAGQGRLLRITSRLRVKDTLRGNGCAARMRCRREKLDRGWWWLPPRENEIVWNEEGETICSELGYIVK